MGRQNGPMGEEGRGGAPGQPRRLAFPEWERRWVGVRVGGAALPCPLRPAPRSRAWLQPGLTFQVSLAGDQSAKATNTAQNSEAPEALPQGPSSPPPSGFNPRPPALLLHAFPQGPSLSASPRSPLPTQWGLAFGGRAPIRPSLTLPGRQRPSPSGEGISRHN